MTPSPEKHHIARNRSSRLLEHRRRAQGFSLPLAHGSVATLSLRVLGRSSQFHRIGYQPGSYVSDPFEAHNQRPFWNHVPDDRTVTQAKDRNLGNISQQGPRNERSR